MVNSVATDPNSAQDQPAFEPEAVNASSGWQKWQLLTLTLGLMVVMAALETVTGIWSHSLALMADSGHVIADGLALGLALLASWLGTHPATGQAPFGWRRIEILAALVNGICLMALSGWIGWEAVQSLQDPHPGLLSLPMLMVAGIGLVVNGLNAWVLRPHSQNDLNLRAVFLHLLGDALNCVGVMLTALTIWLWNWVWMDGLVSLGLAIWLSLSAMNLIRQSLPILLEQSPAHLSGLAIENFLLQCPGVVAVNQVRLWTVAPGQEILTAQVQVDPTLSGWDPLLQQLQQQLQSQFGLRDMTLQLSSWVQAPAHLESDPAALACACCAPLSGSAIEKKLFPSLLDAVRS